LFKHYLKFLFINFYIYYFIDIYIKMCSIQPNNLPVFIQGVSYLSDNTSIDYLTIAANPSIEKTQRVWNLTGQGSFTTNEAIILLDFTNADRVCSLYEITFEDALNGTLIMHNETLSAKCYMTYKKIGNLIFELRIRTKSLHAEKKKHSFYFNVQIKDSTTNLYTLNFTESSSTSNYTYNEPTGTTAATLDILSSSAMSFVFTDIPSNGLLTVNFSETSGKNSVYLYPTPAGATGNKSYIYWSGTQGNNNSLVYVPDLSTLSNSALSNYCPSNWAVYILYTSITDSSYTDIMTPFYMGGCDSYVNTFYCTLISAGSNDSTGVINVNIEVLYADSNLNILVGEIIPGSKFNLQININNTNGYTLVIGFLDDDNNLSILTNPVSGTLYTVSYNLDGFSF